jgi:flagellar biosynthetic protein FlhB
MLAGGAVLSMAGGQALSQFAMRVMRESAGALSAGAFTPEGAVHIMRTLVLGLLAALAPFALGMATAATAVGLAQSRGAMSFAPITPKLSHLNPMSGLKKLVSKDALVNLLKASLKLVVLGFVTWRVLLGNWPEIMSLVETGPAAVGAVTSDLVFHLVFVAGLSFLVIAFADYAWQVVRHQTSLKMTKEQVKHEAKDSDGDPHVKARMRTLHMQRARQRMLQAVPRADVVITNPTHVAVALRYDPSESPAPIVVAMGERKLAERIKAIARDSGVTLVENKPVARALLATCVVGKPIPPMLYAAVAEILAFVFRQKQSAAAPDAWSAA